MELRGSMGRRPLSPVRTRASANLLFWISLKEVNFCDYFDIDLWRRKNMSLWLIFIFTRLISRKVSRLDYIVSSDRIMVDTKLGCEWRREWPELLTSIFLESLRNTTKSLNQDSRRPRRNSKQTSLEGVTAWVNLRTANWALRCIYFKLNCPSD